MNGSGFVDLRTNAEASQTGNESFWPSFTDIMTVVVMIFMLVSVILVLRNWDLVHELRATIEAEREAAALVKSTTEANLTLEEQLAQAEHQVSIMRMWLMQAREENESLTRRQADLEDRIARLQDDKRRLAAERARLDEELTAMRRAQADLEKRFGETAGRLAQLEAAFSEQHLRLEETTNALDRQTETVARKEAELAELRRRIEQASSALAALQGDYDSLKVKYDKLVRPARTPAGHPVVEVRFAKRGGRYVYAIREPGSDQVRQVDRKALESRLGALKQRHHNNLYVKIVIPEDSGLSYTEAWKFTNEILNRYDYYYQPQQRTPTTQGDGQP
ncbi:MAG TPA: hypothetical protein ENK62_01150 [Chromatiales bacterium]|nr:hypothetical protein [Chromatiales bacterium]